MNNPFQLLQMLKQNPVQFILQTKFNVPQNIANDPDAVINHLMRTNQVSQPYMNYAYQIAQRFKNGV